MESTAELSLPTLPVETLEFAADPGAFLEAAQRAHPWLARFSQGYVVYGYQAVGDLLADDENLVPGFGPIIDYYGVRGTMWARFMEEMVLSRSGVDHTRLRASVANAFTPRRANRERAMMQRVITAASAQCCSRNRGVAEYAASGPAKAK